MPKRSIKSVWHSPKYASGGYFLDSKIQKMIKILQAFTLGFKGSRSVREVEESRKLKKKAKHRKSKCIVETQRKDDFIS